MKKYIALLVLLLLMPSLAYAASNTTSPKASDVAIGAVEIKDASADNRANVSDADTARTTATHVIVVQHVDADGEVLDASDLEALGDTTAAHDATVSSTGVQVNGSARSSQAPAVSSGDAARLVTNLYGELVIAGYDWSSGAIKLIEGDPISMHHLEETLVSVTNVTTGTTTYAYFDMDGYTKFTIQNETSGTTPVGTMTYWLECSVQDDGTAPASCTYQDVTNDLFSVASVTDADDMWIQSSGMAFKYCRLAYVALGAANDADLTAYLKKMY